MQYRSIMMVAAILVAASCAPKKRNAWDDIDYSKVHNREARENDSGYTAPSITNCMDDDLYNCNK